jgi:hypothetical protein
MLAALAIGGWPGSTAWALGIVVGVNLMTSGVAITTVAATVRGLVQTAEKALR